MPPAVAELPDGVHEAEIPLLHEVEERNPSVDVLFCHEHDEALVRLYDARPGGVSIVDRPPKLRKALLEVLRRHAEGSLHPPR